MSPSGEVGGPSRQAQQLGEPIVAPPPSQVDQLLAQLVEMLDTRGATGQQVRRDVQVAAVEIAVAMTEKMFLARSEQGELELNRMVTEALSVLQPTGPVVVRLHPDDVRLMQPHLTEIATGQMQLAGDENMPRGNCQIDGEERGIRFDWAIQLQELRQRVLQGLTDADSRT